MPPRIYCLHRKAICLQCFTPTCYVNGHGHMHIYMYTMTFAQIQKCRSILALFDSTMHVAAL